ncbi:MAG: preprotein translocase subunit YajC [Candidatus Omnitrophota bacterium]
MFTTLAYAQETAMPAPTGPAALVIGIIPWIFIFGIFYFFIIRPQQQKQKNHEQMIAALGKNDQVITTGGIYGTVFSVKDNSVVLKVDDDVKIEFQKNAISAVLKTRG